MGNCAEDTAKKYEISRLEQDEYAKRSYMNSARASEDGTLSREIISVSIPQKKGKPDVVVKHDEEYLRYCKKFSGGTFVGMFQSGTILFLRISQSVTILHVDDKIFVLTLL